MQLQTLLDRLQCDIRIIYGLEPQLRVSEIALYEQFWKDLLAHIELIGGEIVHDVCETAPNGVDVPAGCRYYLVRSRQNAEALSFGYYVLVPNGLVDLVYAFWGTRNAGFLRAIRQCCLLTYKSKSNEITPQQTDMAIAGFIERNARCRQLCLSFYRYRSEGEGATSQTLKIARLLFRHILARWDYRDIKPSHGPGAVSDGKGGIDKWRKIDGQCSRLTDKIYPISEYFCPSPGMFDHSQASYRESPAKIAVVPKDKRGPRIICTQPSSAMWIQQGQWRSLRHTIERSRLLQTFAFGERSSSIKFDNQEQNGSLALESSRTRELATIDLSDASDLVSLGLVQYLSHKEVALAFIAARPTYVQLPNGELVRLHMFAPMGSAVCFPVESLVFWVIAAAAMHVWRGVRYEILQRDRNAFKSIYESLQVYVFGDDIIVPTEVCDYVCSVFEDVGFKPNRKKTFSRGFYRESCGVDAYRGSRLDICRLQSTTITSMPDAYASVDLANRARGMGMCHLANHLEAQVESFLGFGLPVGNYGGASWTRGYPCDRWGAQQCVSWNIRYGRKIKYDTDLQGWYGWSIIARPRLSKAPQDGRYRLFRGLTTGVDEHATDWLSPDSTQYYLGWVRLC